MLTPVPPDGVITTSGEYYLAANRTSVGEFNVRVEADGVDLNLNGKILQNSSGSSTAASSGVYVGSRSNVRVRNGRVLGSQFGILAAQADYLTVEDIDFTGCRYIGVSVGALAFGAKVRRCIFGSIGGWSSEAYAIGVNGVGRSGIVEGCIFIEIYRQALASPETVGEGCAVLVSSGATGAVVRQNWFDNSRTGGRKNIALWVAEGATATVLRNTITNFGRGITSAGGSSVAENRLMMRSPEEESIGIHLASGVGQNNVLLGYEQPLNGPGAYSGNSIF